MIQTTICPTLTTVKVSLQVQVWVHILLTRRMHHQCPGIILSTIDFTAVKITKLDACWPRLKIRVNHKHTGIVSQEVRFWSPQIHWASSEWLSHWHPITSIHSQTQSAWTAHNDMTGNKQCKTNTYCSCSRTHSDRSTPKKQCNCTTSQLAPNGSTRRSTILMAPYDTLHTK